jgi:hypothetical protein
MLHIGEVFGEGELTLLLAFPLFTGCKSEWMYQEPRMKVSQRCRVGIS